MGRAQQQKCEPDIYPRILCSWTGFSAIPLGPQKSIFVISWLWMCRLTLPKVPFRLAASMAYWAWSSISSPSETTLPQCCSCELGDLRLDLFVDPVAYPPLRRCLPWPSRSGSSLSSSGQVGERRTVDSRSLIPFALVPSTRSFSSLRLSCVNVRNS